MEKHHLNQTDHGIKRTSVTNFSSRNLQKSFVERRKSSNYSILLKEIYNRSNKLRERSNG